MDSLSNNPMRRGQTRPMKNLDEAEDERTDLSLSIYRVRSIARTKAVFVVAIYAGRHGRNRQVISFSDDWGGARHLTLRLSALVRESNLTRQPKRSSERVFRRVFEIQSSAAYTVFFPPISCATILLALVIGQKLAIPLFIFAYT